MRDIVSPLSGFGSPFGQRRRTFTPAALFAASEPGVWLDPSDPAALFSDTAGTTQAGIGDPVAAARLINDDTLAVQATIASRPILGRVPATGRRNMLTRTEEFENSDWTKSGVTVSPLGGGAWRITEDDTDGIHCVRRSLTLGGNIPRTNAMDFRAGTRGFAYLAHSADGGFTRSVALNLDTGEVFDINPTSGVGVDFTVISLPDGWWRVAVYAANQSSASASRGFSFGALDGENINEDRVGDGESFIDVRFPSCEVDVTDATIRPYQRVGSEFDITEAGVPSLRYLGDPGAASLPATVPDLGTDATLAYATEAGVTILTGQTIGAGALEILRGDRTYGVIANNRPWTPAETAGVTAWLNARIPA